MGIKGLTKLLTTMGAYRTSRLDAFEGNVFAFDVASVIMTYKMNGLFRPWRNKFNHLVHSLRRNYGIESIFVLDGLPPPEKHDERTKRCERRRIRFELVERIEQALQRFVPDASNPNVPDASMDEKDVKILVDVTNKVQRLKCHAKCSLSSKIPSSSSSSSKTASRSDVIVCDETNEYDVLTSSVKIVRCDLCRQYAAYMRSRIRTYTEDFEFVEKVARRMGIQVRRASGEAEIECARLVREGIADVVVTKDTDAFACLCPTIITDIRPNGRVEYVELNDVLAKLRMDSKTFVEMCILCGTDFNAPLRGIDAVTAHRLAKTYGTVENVIECYRDENDATSFQRDGEKYDYDRIRAIFDCVNSSTSERTIA